MRPPICAVCGYRGPECRLIYFKRRPEDEEWHKKVEREGLVGHPPEAEWFCPKHYPEANRLRHLTISEAFKHLRENPEYR